MSDSCDLFCYRVLVLAAFFHSPPPHNSNKISSPHGIAATIILTTTFQIIVATVEGPTNRCCQSHNRGRDQIGRRNGSARCGCGGMAQKQPAAGAPRQGGSLVYLGLSRKRDRRRMHQPLLCSACFCFFGHFLFSHTILLMLMNSACFSSPIYSLSVATYLLCLSRKIQNILLL